MAFKMKGFSGFKQTSPVNELLGVLKEKGEGKGPSGTVDVLGEGKRDMTPGEMASERYMTKTIQKNVPEEDRAWWNNRLARGRAVEGESYEDQAQAMHASMSPAKQTDQKKKAIAKVKREITAANNSSYATLEAKEKDLAQLNRKLTGLQSQLNK